MARCDAPRRECLHHHGKYQDPRPSGPDSIRDLCPAHDDTEHSLSVSVGERQRIIWHCFAGCDELAVRAGLIKRGWREDCLPVSKARERELVDEIIALYAKNLHHAELQWRVWSLVHGFGGEMPAKRGYPGGRRGFFRDAGVGYRQAYDDTGGSHR